MALRFRIGIDLGGTKIEGAAIDGSGLFSSADALRRPEAAITPR